MTLVAAADGSSLGNPGPAGWAWYIDEQNWGAGGFAEATNNIAELTAVLQLLTATAPSGEALHVLCDSQYVINSLTKWMPGWKARGWRKADGKPVLNRELLMQLDEALAGRRVRFEWVRGHTGHPLNEMADTLAVRASNSFRSGTPLEVGPGFAGAAGAGTVDGAALGAAASLAGHADVAAVAAPRSRRAASPDPDDGLLPFFR